MRRVKNNVGLLQNVRQPWRHFVICSLLNRTTGGQVAKILPRLWREVPTADRLASVSPDILAETLRPLGLQNTRAKRLKEMGLYFSSGGRGYPPGSGPYARSSYELLFLKKRPTALTDKKLIAYADAVFPVAKDAEAPRHAVPLARRVLLASRGDDPMVTPPEWQKTPRNASRGGPSLSASVFVEGPNGSGKSSLIEALRKAGLPSIHTGGPKRDERELLSSCRSVASRRRPTVIDRMPMISEIVYDRALGRTAKVDHKELIRRIEKLGDPVVVYCRVPLGNTPPVHGGATHPPEHALAIKKHARDLARHYDLLLSELSARGLIRLVIHNHVESTTADDVLNTLISSGDVCAD